MRGKTFSIILQMLAANLRATAAQIHQTSQNQQGWRTGKTGRYYEGAGFR